jgi:hypothetical protein
MSVTEEDLDKKRERNEKLREQIQTEEAKRFQREADLTNELTAAQLDAEGARLEAQLAAVKESGKASNVKAGVEGPLVSAKEQMEQAVAQQKAQEAAAAAAADEKKES